ncbi:hypothetical protein, partial [uncultured Desulfovibrio sp.]|uniref:hypothetical protein n=1 Tax=uncultured Desulfovibrio sp. TaxID=167968 RepID=UPI002630E7DE
MTCRFTEKRDFSAHFGPGGAGRRLSFPFFKGKTLYIQGSGAPSAHAAKTGDNSVSILCQLCDKKNVFPFFHFSRFSFPSVLGGEGTPPLARGGVPWQIVPRKLTEGLPKKESPMTVVLHTINLNNEEL